MSALEKITAAQITLELTTFAGGRVSARRAKQLVLWEADIPEDMRKYLEQRLHEESKNAGS